MAIMLGDNEIWKSKFNQTSLEGEDWLEPSDSLFEAIESVVYDEAPKQKKKPVLWIVLLVGLIGLLSIAVMLNTDKGSKASDNAVSTISTSTPNPNLNLAIPKATTSSTQISTQNTTPQQISTETATISTPSISNQMKVVQCLSDSQTETVQSQSNNKIASAPAESTIRDIPALSQKKSWNAAESKINKIGSADQLIHDNKISTQDLAANPSSNDTAAQLNITQNALLNIVPRLSFNGFSGLEYRSTVPPMFLGLVKDIKVYNSERKSGFLISVGQSFTQFQLSQSFDPLVAAADFRSSNGSGYTASVGYEKSLSSRIEVNGTLHLSQTRFTSGHNSIYDYQQGLSNQVALTMATPLGFMDGSVVITDATGQNENTSLVLDLFNEHRYRTVGLDLGMAYRLFEFGQLSVKLEGGIGVQRFFGFQNNLDEVVSSNPNFSSSNTNISSTQEDINKLMAMATVGLRLEQSISASHSLLFRYQAGRGLQNLHETSDYSTGLFKQNVSLGVKWFVR